LVSHHEQASKADREQQHRVFWPAYNPNLATRQASTEGLFQQTQAISLIDLEWPLRFDRGDVEVSPDVMPSVIAQRLGALGRHPSLRGLDDGLCVKPKLGILSCQYLGRSFRREPFMRLCLNDPLTCGRR
jgi:hypothetical protein